MRNFLPLPALICAILTLCAASLHAEADLHGRPPEEFDWDKYVGEGPSATDEMLRAREGATLLQKRIDDLCTAYRKLLTKRGEKESLRLFNEMETHWEQSADAQVAMIGQGWEGGTGQRVEIPRARMHACLFHVKELLYLKIASSDLNE